MTGMVTCVAGGHANMNMVIMVVRAFHPPLLICWRFHHVTTSAVVHRESAPIKRKSPVSDGCVKGTVLTFLGQRSEWADCLETTERQQEVV